MPKPLREQAVLAESVDKKTGKVLVDIITPGVGSSGYYSPEVCEAAAGLVTAGTKMFLDHPTDAEERERPVRSVKDIAAVFTESARWDPSRGECGALVAEAQVVPSWIETMDVIQGAIGVSIYGSATDISEGEVDGRRVSIVEGLHAIDSVDFVTRPGRGGAFALMESANPTRVRERAVKRGVSEATANDTREQLQTLVRDAYGAEKTYVWVRDFDDTTVWFEVESGEDSGVYGQPYSTTDGAVALTGDRTEVRVSTTYVPVTRPDSNTPTTEADQEVTMGNIQIDEAEHRSTVEKAGRVDVLEQENATLKRERDEFRARESAVTHARTRVTAANAALPAATVDRIVEAATRTVPLTEAGQLDTTALDTAVDTARTAEETYLAGLAEAAGVGSITGFGGAPADPPDISESDIDGAVGGAFGRQVKEA